MSATEPAATQPAAAAPGEAKAPPPSAAREAPRPARWLDRATALLLAGALGLAVAAAMPSLLRVAGVELPVAEAPELSGDGPGHPPGSRIAVPHPPPEILSHPEARQAPTAGELIGDPEHLHRRLPPGFTDEPNPWVPAEPAEGDTEPRRDPLEYALPNRAVVLLGALWLHEQPTDAARVVGVVQAGQKVTLLTERGEWAIVMYTVGDDQRAGWAKKSEIAVR